MGRGRDLEPRKPRGMGTAKPAGLSDRQKKIALLHHHDAETNGREYDDPIKDYHKMSDKEVDHEHSQIEADHDSESRSMAEDRYKEHGMHKAMKASAGEGSIDQEINELSKSMEESVMDPKDNLIKTLKSMDPKVLKAKLPELTKSEQTLVLSALEDIKKAKAAEMDADYQAKYVRGNVNDTILQEDKADDDQDEKLVKESNKDIKHQGDNSPEGIEGQVIKAEKSDEKKEKKVSEKMADAIDEMAEGEAEEAVEEHEDKMHSKVKKEMKKALAENPNITKAEMVELIKGKMKMLAEEDQLGDAPEMNEKTRAKKEKMPDQIEEAEASKMAQDKVDEMKVDVKKSLDWADENALLKANTLGRNHHFSVNDYYDQILTEKPAAQEVVESVKKSMDLNDLIEKDMTSTWKELESAYLTAENINKADGSLVKSFGDVDIAEALGLTPEEAKQILGEK